MLTNERYDKVPSAEGGRKGDFFIQVELIEDGEILSFYVWLGTIVFWLGTIVFPVKVFLILVGIPLAPKLRVGTKKIPN